jgi:hypothetical protein
VVAGLLGQIPEQVPQPEACEPDPTMLAIDTQQYLRDRQTHQLGVGQPWPVAPALAGRNHVIVDLHIECGQEGVQVVRHSRSWTPSCHVLADRHAAFKESII